MDTILLAVTLLVLALERFVSIDGRVGGILLAITGLVLLLPKF